MVQFIVIAQFLAYDFAFGFRYIVTVSLKIHLECLFEVAINGFVIHADGIFGIHTVLENTILCFASCLIAYIHGILHLFQEGLHFFFILFPVFVYNRNRFDLSDFVGTCPTIKYPEHNDEFKRLYQKSFEATGQLNKQ